MATVYAWSTNGWLLLANTDGSAPYVDSNAWTKILLRRQLHGRQQRQQDRLLPRLSQTSTNLVPVDTSKTFCTQPDLLGQHEMERISCPPALYDVSSTGIAGFDLSGSGFVNLLEAKAGTPTPLSSAINVRAFQGADGVYVEFQTYNEEGHGYVRLYVYDANGRLVWSGTCMAKGSGSNLYRLNVPGMLLGQTYSIRIRDEVGKYFTVAGVTVARSPWKCCRCRRGRLAPVQHHPRPPVRRPMDPPARADQLDNRCLQPIRDDIARMYSCFYPDPDAPRGFFRIVLK